MKEINMAYTILGNPQLLPQRIGEIFSRVLAGESVSIEPFYYDPRKNRPGTGKPGWLGGRLFPIRNRNGEVENVVLVHQDFTEIRRLEEDLRKCNESRHRQLNGDESQ